MFGGIAAFAAFALMLGLIQVSPASAHELTAKVVAAAGGSRAFEISKIGPPPEGLGPFSGTGYAAISANGRFVAFDANRTTEDSSYDEQYGQNLFVSDLQQHTTVLLSHLPRDFDKPAVLDSGHIVGMPAISADGSEVAFTGSGNFVEGPDTGHAFDAYVVDRASRAIHRLDAGSLGFTVHAAHLDGISLSGDGSRVADVLIDDQGQDHIVVNDWKDGTAFALPATAGEHYRFPQLSTDGKTLAVEVDQRTQHSKIRMYDLTTKAAVVTLATTYVPDYQQGTPPYSMSANGRFVSYSAAAQQPSLRIWDRHNPSSPVTVTAPDGADSREATMSSSLSADGTAIAYTVAGTDNHYHSYVASPPTATPVLVTAAADGMLDRGFQPKLSGDGSELIFTSYSSTLTADSDGSQQVYLARAADVSAPNWPSGAALRADSLTPTSLRLHWPSATDDHGVTGYRLTRDGKPLHSLDADVHDYQVTGLTAGTRYTFGVRAVDAAGNGTGELTKTLTTPTPTATSLSFSVPFVDGANAVALGSDLAITLRGAPTGAATARIVYQVGSDQHSASTKLTEDSTGRYGGKFRLTEGTTKVVSVTGILTVGGQTQKATADGLPLPVSGALAVTVGKPGTGSVKGAKLTALSPSTGAGAQLVIDGPGTVTLPLAAATDYRLTLSGSDGYRLAGADAPAVTAGKTAAVSLTPATPAALSVTVAAPDGTPLPDVDVELLASDGSFLGYQQIRKAGDTATFAGLSAPADVTILTTTYDNDRPVRHKQTTTHTLTSGPQKVTITQEHLPTATVHGMLTVGDQPSAGRVVATERVNGKDWTYAADAGADGMYVVTVLAGKVTVTASASGSPVTKSSTQTLTNAQSATVDLDLPAARHYTLQLALATKSVDGRVTKQPVEWPTTVHFGVDLHSPYRSYAAAPTVAVLGVPGEVFTWCASGNQAGLSSACSSVTLSKDKTVPLSVTLVAVGRITGTLLGADGRPYAGSWQARVVGADPQASRTDFRYGNGSELSLTVPAAGDYYLSISGGGGNGDKQVTVPAGKIVDLGRITLADSGQFDGSVTAERNRVVPGQVASFRAEYTYNGPDVSAATMRLETAQASALTDYSIVVDGKPGQASFTDGVAEIPLGALKSGAHGTMHFRARIPDGSAGGAFTLAVGVRYDGKKSTLGSATATIEGVDMVGPSVTTTLRPSVSGRAPAGATVTVLDARGTPVGRAQAGPGGQWSASLALPDRGDAVAYALRAKAATGTTKYTSPVVYVTYDTAHQVPSKITVSQPDAVTWAFAPAVGVVSHTAGLAARSGGRSLSVLPGVQRFDSTIPGPSGGRPVSVDPRTGLARFPFVVVPGEPIAVSVEFPHPERVSGLTVRIGDVTAPAHDGTATLRVPLNKLGPIYLDYTDEPADRSPADLLPPAGADPRTLLSRPFDDYANAKVTDGGEGSKTTTFDLPDYGKDGVKVHATSTVGQPTSYTPTKDDLAFAARLGIPIYGFHPDVHVDPDDPTTLDFGFTGYIATSWLQSASAIQRHAVRASVADAAAGDAAGGEIEVTPIKVAGKMAGAVGAINFALHAGEAHDRLAAFGDQLDYLPPDEQSRVSEDMADFDHDITLAQVGKAALFAIGLIGGFAILGPVGAIAVGLAFQHAFSKSIDDTLSDARREVADECRIYVCPPKKQKLREFADPYWLIDPSGYTYEAVTSNRLPGVTTTLLTSSSKGGPFRAWDAADYGQVNPLLSDPMGRYGWDVPKGFWKVAYSKPGYVTAYSKVFDIPPPRFDVNVGLTRLAAPTVNLTRATSGKDSSVTVGFDDYMNTGSVTGRITIADTDGNAIAGKVRPVDEQTAPDGKTTLATTFRFTPDAPLTAGQALSLTVDALVRDYANHTLDHALTKKLTAAAPAPPRKPSDIRAFAGDAHSATIEWAAPADDGGRPVTGYHVSVSPGGKNADLDANATSATIGGLDPNTDYTLSVAAVNAAGTGEAAAAEPVSTPASPSTPPVPPGGGSGGGSGSGDSTNNGGSSGTVLTELAGQNRVLTAVAVSKASFPDSLSAGAVVLARSNAFPDGLTGGPLAVDRHAPLLITKTGQLDTATKTELVRVLAKGKTVYLLGGTGALSETVAKQIRALGYRTKRYGGDNRFATAVAIASALDKPKAILLTTGSAFPDALAASAAASALDGVVLLTRGTKMAAETTSYLEKHIGVPIYAIGGPAAAADPAAVPVFGSDRYDTAVKVAQRFFADANAVGISSGALFPDALSASARLGGLGAPLLLTRPDRLPAKVGDWLDHHRDALQSVEIFGGPAAVDVGVRQAVKEALSP